MRRILPRRRYICNQSIGTISANPSYLCALSATHWDWRISCHRNVAAGLRSPAIQHSSDYLAFFTGFLGVLGFFGFFGFLGFFGFFTGGTGVTGGVGVGPGVGAVPPNS